MRSMQLETPFQQWSRAHSAAVVALAACCSLLGATESHAEDKKVAVILTTSGQMDGLPPGQIRGSIRGTLADELKTYAVLTEEEGQALLTNAKGLGLNCKPNENDCLLKLGILGNVNLLISPMVSKKDGKQAVTISVFDVDTGAKRGEATRVLSSSDAAASAARSAMIELMAPEKYRGRFAINVNVAGADVQVDGVSVGTTPLAAPLELKAGEHQLDITAEGYPAHSSKIDVLFGKLTSVTVTMRSTAAGPDTTAPDEVDPPGAAAGSPLKFPIVAGLGAVAGIAAVVAAVSWGIFGYQTFEVFLLDGEGGNFERLEKGEGLVTDVDIPTARVIGIIGAAATVVAVVFGGAAGASYALVE